MTSITTNASSSDNNLSESHNDLVRYDYPTRKLLVQSPITYRLAVFCPIVV